MSSLLCPARNDPRDVLTANFFFKKISFMSALSVFGHTKGGHQIPLQEAVSQHVRSAHKVRACNLSTWQVESGGPEVAGHPSLLRELDASLDSSRLHRKEGRRKEGKGKKEGGKEGRTEGGREEGRTG